ncbi:YciI family protein, partial [Streptomyces nojiriensis]|uniref:YciI family protein n=1 Tax=Streptomyces nojiriensis TaxID=66374 RepID=UPI0019204091
VTYTAPLNEVDQWRPAHGDWLNQLIAQRLLLVAGRRVPLVGGVYLAAAMPAEELERLLATDPYIINGGPHTQRCGVHTTADGAGLEDL